MQWIRNLAIAALAVGASLALPGSSLAQETKLIEQIKKRGKIMVGIGSFIPWAMRNKQGEWVGFEIDVSAKLAKDMGVTVELFPTAWDAVIPSLQAGKFDVIIGGLSITDARKQQVDFSDPYSRSGQGIAASKALAGKLKFPEEFNSTSVTVACRRGSISCKVAEEKFPKATVRQFDDDAVAFQEVINGGAHCIITSEPKPTFFVLQNPEKLYKPTEDYLTQSREGFAVKKGNPEALAFFNAWIATNEAWLKERHAYWFKGRAWADSVPQN